MITPSARRKPARSIDALLAGGCALALALSGAPQVRAQDLVPTARPTETPAGHDARMKWWREAKFGMFIHWGVYAVPAGTYKGEQIKGIGEWIMNRGKIPVAEYREYSKGFNPVEYDPDAWVRLAKAAGMKYIIITSKHHDGFALFDTKASDWNIVKATPYGKDVLKPLAEACKKHGMKLGFYYSQAQDWNNPGGTASGGHWDPAQAGDMDAYLRNVAAPQLREILSNYGPIATLWWDTPTDMTRERAEILLPELKKQPQIIMNNRLGGGYSGDTETPEQYVPPTGFPGRDWETCMTMNDTWGFKSYDTNWKSTETLVRNLVDIASKGGNYLLNVGPTAQGVIPAPSVERLQQIGAWMKANSEAIYATSASPFRRLAWGRCTQKATGADTTLYLHVFDWPKDGQLLVPGLKNQVKSAALLVGNIRLKATTGGEGVLVAVPATAPDAISSTVVLTIKGKPEVEPYRVEADATGALVLTSSDTTLHGEGVKREIARTKNHVNWVTASTGWVEWPLKIARPGEYNVTAEFASQGAGSISATLGDQKLTANVTSTDDLTKFQSVELGTLKVMAPGAMNLEIRADAPNWQQFNLKTVQLKPVR